MNIPKEIIRVDINNILEELVKSMENKMNTFAEKIENLELSNDDTSNESVKYSLQIWETELNVNNQTHFYFYFLKITQIPKTSSFSFISVDIGGALGIFINFIEMFEFILDVFLISFSN